MSWECSACAGRQLILLLFYFNLYFCTFGSLPFAFCLRLCHLLPAATAAAAWHSDCWNWTKNFACATAAFSLLRAGVATSTSTLTVTTTPTPTTTTATTHEKLAALAALVLVFLQWIVRSRGFHVCVCCCRCRCQRRRHRLRRGMQNSNFFSRCLFYFFCCTFALALIAKEQRVYWVCVILG